MDFSSSTTRLLILFPGALGDFLCALPSLLALQCAQRGSTLLMANPSSLELVEHGPFRAASVHRREVADLFGSGTIADATRGLFADAELVHSWTGYDDPSFTPRLQSITTGTVHVHRFRGMRAGEHAVDYYARCTGIRPLPAQVWTTPPDQAWADQWCARHAAGPRPLLLVHPGSGSPRKNWEGFPRLLARLSRWWRPLGGMIAVLAGPAERERSLDLPSDLPIVRDAGLRQVAALLTRTAVYVGNDSGVSHLAAIVGTPSVVLFGPSDPRTWAPRGLRVEVLAAPEACARCGPDRFCTHRLEVEQVIAAIERTHVSGNTAALTNDTVRVQRLA